MNELVSVIKNISNDIVICGHKNADYDSMCSSLALAKILKKLNKNVKVYIEPNSVHKVDYFKCSDLLCDYIEFNDYTFIALDMNNILRLPEGIEKYYNNASLKINIDHHNGNTTNADYILSNPNKSSTCEMIYDLIKLLEIDLDKDISELLFTGIVSDTNLFSTGVSDKTFLAVSNLMSKRINNEFIVKKFYLEKTKEELEIISYIINNLIDDKFYYAVLDMNKEPFNKVSYSDISKKCIPSILDCENIDILMIIMNYGEKIKGEIRSKSNVDVSLLAKLLTGGGHTHAAGFSNKKSINEIIDISNNYLDSIKYEKPNILLKK